MDKKAITVSPNLGTILLITFVVLKLTKVINWSWWWVLSPLWIPFGLLAIGALIIGITEIVLNLIDRYGK